MIHRSRIAFITLIALSFIVLAGAAIYRFHDDLAAWLRGGSLAAAPVSASSATALPQPVASPSKAAAVATQASRAASPTAAATVAPGTPLLGGASPTTAATATADVNRGLGRRKPIWGPNFKANDGLGNYICGADSFGSYNTLQQIQMTGLDVKLGFHLGIVPFDLNDDYAASESDRAQMMQRGDIDCLLTTMNSFALNDPGVITAFVDESAGADQVWARGMKTLNDIKGKRITFASGGVSEFFTYYLLNTIQLDPKTDVQLIPQPTIDEAVKFFNDQKADVVVGWEPTIFGAEKSGGKLLASTHDFRPIVDVIVTSRKALADKRTVVDLFHDAWFAAIGQQEDDFASAAKTIASWGNNDFTGVKPDSASDDLRSLLTNVAQANLADNARAVYHPTEIVQRLRTMRDIWATAGYTVPTSDITQLVEPHFIQATAQEENADLGLPNRLVNSTFSIGRFLIRTDATQVSAATAAAATSATTPATANGSSATPKSTPGSAPVSAVPIASLPCTRFEFVPNSTSLSAASRLALRNCAVNVLKQNIGLFVRVRGSSAWPGPKGSYTQQQVEGAAKGRAQAVVDFLVAEGIAANRFSVEWTLPPQDHWETGDIAKQAQDRYVEITLLSSGL